MGLDALGELQLRSRGTMALKTGLKQQHSAFDDTTSAQTKKNCL